MTTSKDAFIKAGWWPDEVLWKCWQQAYQAGMDSMREDTMKAILSGSFLHDQAPAKVFADEVAKRLRGMK